MATSPRILSDRTGKAVLGITALALVARLYELGARIAHWDEGRVAYWIYQYAQTGTFEYRPIVHGPFLPIVNRHVFAIFGLSDFSMRLIVALFGGLMPLAAWLFRERLRDSEVVALSALFAVNPLLLYYSRFMRNDVIVAACMIFAVGFFVRTLDTKSPWYLYAGVGAVAVAFAAKENALLYPVSWLGAAALLLDHRLFRVDAPGRRGVAADGGGDGDWVDYLTDRARTGARGAWRWKGPLVLAGVEFLAILVFFYAPRGGGYPGVGREGRVGLWSSLGELAGGDPGPFLTVVEKALAGSWEKFNTTWAGGHQDHAYIPFFEHFVTAMLVGGLAVTVFAVVGFLADRYAQDGPRDLVALASYWGFASVLGYPIVTDIKAAWAVVHALAPLAIPAAVGIALVYRWGRTAHEEGDPVGVGAAAVVLLVVFAGTAGVAADVSYLRSTDEPNKELIQWAQPHNDLKPTLQEARRVTAGNEGPDVLFVGSSGPSGGNSYFYVTNESGDRLAPATGPGWHSRLPLQWYFAAYDMEVTSVPPDYNYSQFGEDTPPVVVAYGWDRDRVEPYLRGYAAHEHGFKLWGEDVVVFIDETPDDPGPLSPADRFVGNGNGDFGTDPGGLPGDIRAITPSGTATPEGETATPGGEGTDGATTTAVE